jgi:hypothetical protein
MAYMAGVAADELIFDVSPTSYQNLQASTEPCDEALHDRAFGETSAPPVDPPS